MKDKVKIFMEIHGVSIKKDTFEKFTQMFPNVLGDNKFFAELTLSELIREIRREWLEVEAGIATEEDLM